MVGLNARVYGYVNGRCTYVQYYTSCTVYGSITYGRLLHTHVCMISSSDELLPIGLLATEDEVW